MGTIGSSAGSPLAQSQGAEVSRAQQETAGQARQTRMAEKAEQAAGVGQTEEDEEANERDADGRRPWEIGARRPVEESTETEPAPIAECPGKDPTGMTGSQLDLRG
jgi:hypothetical protein